MVRTGIPPVQVLVQDRVLHHTWRTAIPGQAPWSVPDPHTDAHQWTWVPTSCGMAHRCTPLLPVHTQAITYPAMPTIYTYRYPSVRTMSDNQGHEDTPMSTRSGRSGMGSRPYRRARAQVLAESDLCHLCGHEGATSADHIITDEQWPRDEYGRRLPGFDAVTNLAPAHGSMGNTGAVNRCPTCGRACNQSRRDKPLPQMSRRPW